MPEHLKAFETLAYAAVGVLLLSTLLRPSWEDVLYAAIEAIIIIALVWAAARRRYRWAAWVFAVLVAIAVPTTAVMIWTGSAGWWQEALGLQPLSKFERVLNVIVAGLYVGAVYYYFFGGKNRTAPETSA